MNQWIDSHAHVYMEEFNSDRTDVLLRSQEQGLKKIYMPNIDVSSIDAMMTVEQKYPNYCVAMMGLHPCYVNKYFERDLYVVEEWLSKRAFAAVGEIGLDLYRGKKCFEQQKEVFVTQMKWAINRQLPIVIHCREAMDETIALIEANYQEGMKGVFHCFTGSVCQAQRIFKLGFYIGLGGVSTFKNGGLTDVIPQLKQEHILLETDSPYLCPTPYRGRRNEPTYIPIIAKRVATLMQLSTKELSVVTSKNAETLFKL